MWAVTDSKFHGCWWLTVPAPFSTNRPRLDRMYRRGVDGAMGTHLLAAQALACVLHAASCVCQAPQQPCHGLTGADGLPPTRSLQCFSSGVVLCAFCRQEVPVREHLRFTTNQWVQCCLLLQAVHVSWIPGPGLKVHAVLFKAFTLEETFMLTKCCSSSLASWEVASAKACHADLDGDQDVLLCFARHYKAPIWIDSTVGGLDRVDIVFSLQEVAWSSVSCGDSLTCLGALALGRQVGKAGGHVLPKGPQKANRWWKAPCREGQQGDTRTALPHKLWGSQDLTCPAASSLDGE